MFTLRMIPPPWYASQTQMIETYYFRDNENVEEIKTLYRRAGFRIIL